MASNFYKKLFISEIKETLKDEDSESDVIKILMKSRILGIITGIQKFSRRTIYSVDDGTSTLDCVLWHNKLDSANRMDICLSKNSENSVLQNTAYNSDLDDICQVLLNKVHVNEEVDYTHGDMISCLGNVKVVKRKLLLDINHHYKVNNVNAETLWILDVLFNHQLK